jgi:hypothetical protein
MKIKCLKCNTIIESLYRHDFVKCECGECFIDGGKEYTRYGCNDIKNIELINEEKNT